MNVPSRRLIAGSFSLCVALAACATPGSTPRATAEAFLDAHYVRIDLEAGREYCTGLALEKLAKEIALTHDIEIGEDTRRPRVTYSLVEFEDADDRAHYAYELAIAPGGADTFRKVIVVSLRKEDGGWRVSNYTESDKPTA
jgi:hypothetical protein